MTRSKSAARAQPKTIMDVAVGDTVTIRRSSVPVTCPVHLPRAGPVGGTQAKPPAALTVTRTGSDMQRRSCLVRALGPDGKLSEPFAVALETEILSIVSRYQQRGLDAQLEVDPLRLPRR